MLFPLRGRTVASSTSGILSHIKYFRIRRTLFYVIFLFEKKKLLRQAKQLLS